MNTQDILRNGGPRLDVVLDFSEYYDYRLCEPVIVDDFLNYIDIVLDYSEFYDYTLGDNAMDYIYRGIPVEECKFIKTEDDYVLETHDNFYLLYR